jgi:hypothetical protein
MAGTTGLEPVTSAVTGQRSNQLSYVPRRSYYSQLILCHERMNDFEASAYVRSFLFCRSVYLSFESLGNTKLEAKLTTQRQNKSIRS